MNLVENPEFVVNTKANDRVTTKKDEAGRRLLIPVSGFMVMGSTPCHSCHEKAISSVFIDRDGVVAFESEGHNNTFIIRKVTIPTLEELAGETAKQR